MKQVWINRRSRRNSGFTLIELVVAIGIFSIFMLIILGIFTRLVFSQRREIGEQELQEDLRLTLELFNREARLGFGETFEAGTDAIAFRNQNGECVLYEVNGGRIVRDERAADSGLTCLWLDYDNKEELTDNRTIIEELNFIISPSTVDADSGDLLKQGLVTVVVKARAGSEGAVMRLQSTVASRQTQTYITFVTPIVGPPLGP